MNRKQTVIALTILAFFILSALAVRHFIRPRVVARAVAPNGIELCVVQTLGEPFNTSVHYRKPGGPWGWFYYDHEDNYWGRGRTEIDLNEKRIKILRGHEVTATFAWETETFHLPRLRRTMVGAQSWAALGKNPWD